MFEVYYYYRGHSVQAYRERILHIFIANEKKAVYASHVYIIALVDSITGF